MDPVLKVWLYEQWIGDHRDDAELAKNHAYLVGSFWNPEAVRQLMSDNTHESTDEEYEESLRIVRESSLDALQKEEQEKEAKGPRKRKRRIKRDQ